MAPRLTTDFWVAAYRARLAQHEIPAFLTAKGDPSAGSVLVKLNTLDGRATVWQRRYDMMTDTRTWEVLAQGAERDVDASIARQRGFDGDLWVIEVEDRAGRHLLGEEGL